MKIQQTYIFIFISQIFISAFALLAIIWSLFVSANLIPFVVLLILSVFFSGSIYILLRNNSFIMDKSTCILSMFISWFILICMGLIPFYIMLPDKSILDLILITISLLSTFGLWLENPLFLSSEFLIWQSLLQWLGGLTSILIASFLVESVLVKNKMQNDIFNIDNFKIIFIFYFLITILFSLIFFCYETYTFDQAIRLSMAMISTSNSFTENGTILINESFSIKIFMIIAMIFGSISITLHFKSFNYGMISYFKNTNFISIILFFLFLVFLISIYVSNNIKVNVYDLFIDILFLVVSFITTTGLIPENLISWNILGNFLIFLMILTLVGGAVNSTTGGLKVSRIIFILKFIYRELYKLGNPRIILSKENLSLGNNTSRIFIFCILFLFTIFLLSSLLSLCNVSFVDSFTIIISSITNSGLGLLNVAEIDYYPQTFFEKFIIFIALLLGRIEVFFIMLVSSSYFWKYR